MADHVPPVLTSGRGGRRLDQLEVLGAVGVRDDEEALAVVLDLVLDVLLAGGQQPEPTERVAGLEEPHLGGDLAVQREEQVPLGLRLPHRDVEPVVVLLEHEHVLAGRLAQAVAPQLVGAHGPVGAHVEQMAVVGRPAHAVVGVLDHIVEQRRRRQVLHPHRVALGAGRVGGEGEQGLAGAGCERAEREELVAGGELVLVEDRVLVAVGPAAPAAVHRVLLALLRPAQVPPLAPLRRDRQVGLLDAGDDLLVQLLPERLGVSGHRGRVVVLRLQQGEDLGIGPIAQPVPVVDPLVAVGADGMRPPGRGRGHRRRGRRRQGCLRRRLVCRHPRSLSSHAAGHHAGGLAAQGSRGHAAVVDGRGGHCRRPAVRAGRPGRPRRR